MAQRSKQLTKRQLVDAARLCALEARWDDAIVANKEIIDRFHRDAEAHNRLGRAYLALGQLADAAEAYSNSLRFDPANLIARRNLQRLDALRHREALAAAADDNRALAAPMPRTAVFIEEVGKTWVDELVNPAPQELLAEVLPGEQVMVERDGDRLIVKRHDGTQLGEIESRTAGRVIELMEAGNRYEAYALGLSGQSVRVILREVFHDPSLGSTVSFPRQITSRAYLRERDLLRQRDEADFLFLDEDDDEEDEAAAPDADEEESPESETEQFVEDPVTVVDEEESQI